MNYILTPSIKTRATQQVIHITRILTRPYKSSYQKSITITLEQIEATYEVVQCIDCPRKTSLQYSLIGHKSAYSSAYLFSVSKTLLTYTYIVMPYN